MDSRVWRKFTFESALCHQADVIMSAGTAEMDDGYVVEGKCVALLRTCSWLCHRLPPTANASGIQQRSSRMPKPRCRGSERTSNAPKVGPARCSVPVAVIPRSARSWLLVFSMKLRRHLEAPSSKSQPRVCLPMPSQLEVQSDS